MSRHDPIVPAPPDPATPEKPSNDAAWHLAFSRLTRRQQEALADIAFIGDGTGWHQKTLDSLAARGLIEPYRQESFGPGGSPIDRIVLVVTRYRMPFHVHIHFCEWLETLPDDYFGDEG